MTALVVFTRDLRVHDNPALAAACATGEAVMPLFVLDDAALAASPCPNREAFLADALSDLDRSLQRRGSRLTVLHGAWTSEVLRVAEQVAATSVHLAQDVSGFAQRRIERLHAEGHGLRLDIVTHPGVTVVPPGDLKPAGGGEYKVFTPYYRRWAVAERRPVVAPPDVVQAGTDGIVLPGTEVLERLRMGRPSPRRARGGEREARRRLDAWASDHLAGYEGHHNDLAADATSRLSPYLHLGCLSPNEVVSQLAGRAGAGPFLRQLCWRDFYHQVLAAKPEAARRDYRPAGRSWSDDADGLDAWRTGQTGYPLVDAAMRQLQGEGFMANRARLVTASFLTKDLNVDWRSGAAHFLSLLLDGDVANNQLNWQWVAGTGTDTNPNRVFNPVVQSRRFDPAGAYIRRFLPELAELSAAEVHWPGSAARRRLGYPLPIVDHQQAMTALRASTRRR